MLDSISISIGIAALSFLFGYLAGEQNQGWAVTPAARPEGADHG